MKSLERLAARWKIQNTGHLSPHEESIVTSTFSDARITAPADLIALYGAIGGMEVHDDKLWRLWPLHEVAERKGESNEFGVLFSDYLIDSWGYRVKPNDAGSCAVYVDYYNGTDPILVANTLAEFFDSYVKNADHLLTRTD